MDNNFKGIFITATDTGVGKTVVSCGIASALRKKGVSVGAWKPFVSGGVQRENGMLFEDSELLIQYAGSGQTLDEISPLRFVEPLAPVMAARIEKRQIELRVLRDSFENLKNKFSFVVAEGVGGLLVPIGKKYNLANLILETKMPVVIVTRPDLGTLNHTLLTVEACKTRNIPILGLVISRSRENLSGIAVETNPGALEEFTRLPILSDIPYLGEPLPPPDKLAEIFLGFPKLWEAIGGI